MIRKTSAFLIPICAGVIGVAGAQQVPKTQLTARELFYAAVESPKPATPVKPQAKAPRKPAAKPESARETRKTENRAPAPPHHNTPAAPEAGFVQLASERTTAPAPTAGPPLGLKCTILKLTDGEMTAVPADTVFHAGDKIQLEVQANSPGYLYIISKGSSGTWKPMFPSSEVEDGNNHVDGWHAYTLPPKSRMVFDQQTGTERIFIVFSREPETDLEKTIYSLQGGKAEPAAAPQETPKPKQMIMTASVDEATVGRLRNTFSRDLVIERVDENTPGEKKETAVYVVNPTGSPDSRVVADLALVHQ
jgi:Domain of unknown function (DUF4384)